MLETKFLASSSCLSMKRVNGGSMGLDFDLWPFGICMGLMDSGGGEVLEL